jgi:HK97 family phage major capsid protein
MPDDMNAVFERLTELEGNVKSGYDKIDLKAEKLGTAIDVLKEKVNEGSDLTDIQNTLKDLQKDLKEETERTDNVEKAANDFRLSLETSVNKTNQSAGQIFVKSENFKDMQKGAKHSGEVEVKAITTPPSTGPRTPTETEQTVNGLIVEPDRPTSVRDLIPAATTNSMLIKFVREDVFTNNAAPVAEGAVMPESDITFSADEVSVKTLGHFIHASDQVLSDVNMLTSHIDGRLRIGLDQVEENQLLLGDGTGENILGLTSQATPFDMTGIPNGAASNMVDKIRWSKLQVRKSFYAGTGVVLNPIDYAMIELLKDADNKYLYSAFQSANELRLWGMRVVESDAIAQGTFMVGAFATAAEIWDRQQATVEMSSEDRDNFIRGMMTLRARKRLALSVYRPKSFVLGDF